MSSFLQPMLFYNYSTTCNVPISQYYIDDFFCSIQHIYFLGESNKSLYMVTNEYLISSIFNLKKIFYVSKCN